MTSEKDLRLVLGTAIVLLVVGVVCYAYTSSTYTPPEQPVRIMFEKGGRLLFTHKTHTSESGYGISCEDCHHAHYEADLEAMACGDCHQAPTGDAPFAQACIDCHEDEDTGISVEDIEGTEVMESSAAYHQQCKNCHEEVGSGPGNSEDDCRFCHTMARP